MYKTITKEQFNLFKNVQEPGTVNMFDIQAVSGLSGLTPDKIKAIIVNFDKLSEQFNTK